jgi:opacity protein-like surface antigen
MKREIWLCALVMMLGSTCLASPRGGPEVYLIGHWDAGTESKAEGAFGTDVTLEMDNGFGGGVGVGLNFGPFVNLNFSGVYSVTDIEIRNDFGGSVSSDDTSTLHLSANLEIYPFDAPFTPLIGGGVGVINISGEIGNDDISETDFAYNFTAGVRWDIDDHVFLKAQYRIIFFEFEDSEDTDPVHAAELALGWRF